MQAAAFKDKKGGNNAGNHKDAHDPDYENITLTFRNRDQPRGSHSAPVNGAQPRPSSDTAQIPTSLHRAIVSLYVLLALTFLFFVTLSVLILLKNSEMSRELLSLKRELWNASSAAQESQEEQRKGWRTILKNTAEAMKGIGEIQAKVHSGNERLKTVPAEITQINKNTQKILEELGRKTSPQSTPQ